MQSKKYDGPGRPLKGKEHKKIMSISLEPRLIALLDENLDKGSRSEFIENLIKRFLKWGESPPKIG